jgi:hypothetical protein
VAQSEKPAFGHCSQLVSVDFTADLVTRHLKARDPFCRGVADEVSPLLSEQLRCLSARELALAVQTFPFTDALERLLEAQKVEHDRLKAEDVICPWVFNRSNRKVKGKRITTFI